MSDQPPWDQSIERQIPGLREAVASLSSVVSNSRFRVVTIVLSPHQDRPDAIPPPTRIAITPEAEADSQIVAATAGEVHTWAPAHPRETLRPPAESPIPPPTGEGPADEERQVSRRSKRASTSLLEGESDDGSQFEKRKRFSGPPSGGQQSPSGAFWGTVLQERPVSEGVTPAQRRAVQQGPIVQQPQVRPLPLPLPLPLPQTQPRLQTQTQTQPLPQPPPLQRDAGRPITGLGQRLGMAPRSYTGMGHPQGEAERLHRMSTLPALRLRSPTRQRNAQPALPSLQDPLFGATAQAYPDRIVRSPGRGDPSRYATPRSFRRTASHWLGRLSPFGGAGPSVSSGTLSPLVRRDTPLGTGPGVALPSMQGTIQHPAPETLSQRIIGDTIPSHIFPGVQPPPQFSPVGQYASNLTQHSGSASGSGVSQAQPPGASLSPPAEISEIQRVIPSTRGRRGRRIGTSQERDQVFSCDRCTSTFKRKSDKNRHVRVVHEKSRPFNCPICQKTFGEKSNMLKHRASVHDDVRTFRCPYCELSFPQRGLCDTHVRSVHDKKQAKYFCEHCGLPFSRKVQLNEHYEQAHPEYMATYSPYYSSSPSTAPATAPGPSLARDTVRDDRALVGDTITPMQQPHRMFPRNLPTFGSAGGPAEGRTIPPAPPALPYPPPQLPPQQERPESEEERARRRRFEGDNSGL